MGILKKLFKKNEYSELLTYVDFLISAKKKQLLIKKHAIEHAIDMIAKTIAKSEIQMYLYNSETQKIERNQNNQINVSAVSSTPNNTSGSWITNNRFAEGFAGGSGTEDDPYQISTAEQLAYLAYTIYNDLAPVEKVTETDTDSNGQVEERRTYYYNYLNTYFELTNSINLASFYWQPIGRVTDTGTTDVPNYHYRYFAGHFDGNDYSVIGIYTKSAMGQGLFGAVGTKSDGSAATISNLHVSGNILGLEQTAGVIGRADYVDITNCSNAATISSDKNYIGGIVGRCEGTVNITNCWNLGTVNGGSYTGGIAGYGPGSSIYIKNCYNKGAISGGGHVGGIVGWGGQVSNCYNSGRISANSGTTGGTGGIVGGGTIVLIQRCYNDGNIRSLDHVGGILGYSSLTSGQRVNVYDCYNTGTINGRNAIGGITGEIRYWAGANITITRCYNAGSISGSSQVGGISGLIYKYGGSATISNCINIGSVAGSNRGGIVGDRTGSSLLGSISYSNNKYNKNIGAVDGATQSGCTYVSTLADDIKTQDYFTTNYSTWDFGSVWQFVADENNGYPIFQYQTQPYNIIFNALGGNANFADVEGLPYDYSYSNNIYSYSDGDLNITYNTSTHELTLNGTGNVSPVLPSGIGISFIEGEQYQVQYDYVSGSTSGGVGCLVLEINDASFNSLSPRNHTDFGIPVSGSQTATVTVSSTSQSQGKVLKNWFWYGDTSTYRTFSNLTLRLRTANLSNPNELKIFSIENQINAVTSPYRDGFIFKGYYSQPNGEGTRYFDETGACVLQPEDDIVLYAAWEDNTWLAHAADSFAGGRGTQSSPYLIATAEQLALLAKNVYNGTGTHTRDAYIYEGVYFKQTANIDLSQYKWVPIGVYYNLYNILTDYNFSGIYDGGGYTISGIELPSVTGGNADRRGLFGVISGNGCSVPCQITNVHVKDSTLTGTGYIGGIVGYANTNTTISNCSVDATITGTGNCIGGIVGGGGGTSVTNCEAYGSVTGVHYTGGIMGNGKANVSGCSNYAIVKGNERVGGMIGNGFNCSVSGCFNFEKISGSAGVGGIVGFADNMDIVKDYNLGMVNTTGSYAGGIAGRITNNTTIKFGVNTGKITSDNFAGGIAGDTITGSTITQSLNLGDIISTGINTGGILGSASNANVSTITNCYSNCNISASSCGALVGGTNAVTISYCAGISNTGSGFYASTSQSGVTNSYVVCNGVLTLSQTTSGMDGNFGYNASFHGGVPIPLGIYAITEFFTQTGIQSYLQNNF